MQVPPQSYCPAGHEHVPPTPEHVLPPVHESGLLQHVPGAMHDAPHTEPPVGFGCEHTPLKHSSVVHGLLSVAHAVPSG
jgi:hypothetical protein